MCGGSGSYELGAQPDDRTPTTETRRHGERSDHREIGASGHASSSPPRSCHRSPPTAQMIRCPDLPIFPPCLRVSVVGVLRPPHAVCRRRDREYRTGWCSVEHLLGATPLGSQHEQSLLVRPSEHAGEASTVKVDCLQHISTLAHAHAAFVGNVCVPDGLGGIDTNAVRNTVSEIGPHPPVLETSICGDVKSRELPAVSLGPDQYRVVTRHVHADGEGDAVSYLSHRAIGGDHS